MDLYIQVLVAVLGFFGVIAAPLCGVYIATKTNRKEKENTAQLALDAKLKTIQDAQADLTKNQLAVKDLRIAELEEDLAECKAEQAADKTSYEKEIADLKAENYQLRTIT